MESSNLSGSCLCGAVQYTASGEPQRFYHCHCRRCRKVTGTAHASNLFLEGALRWDSGEDQVAHYKLPEAARFANAFCRVCGSRVPRFIESHGVVMIPAGSLDEEPALAVQARIFTDSRALWSCTGDDVPEFPEYPA